MSETIYKKVGRKYVPIKEFDSAYNAGFPKGCHLVICEPGKHLYKYNIEPELAPLIAASTYAREAISKTIQESLAMRPSSVLLTEEQKNAWVELSKAFGDECHPLQYPSIYEAVENGLYAMVKEAASTLQNPTVKAAYDNFMLVYQLTK